MNRTAANFGIQSRDQFRKSLRDALSELDGSKAWPADQCSNKEIKIGHLRRRGIVRIPDKTRTLTLIEDEDGVLFWEDGAVLPMAATGQKRGIPRSARRGNVVDQLIIEPPEPNQIGEALEWVDGKLTKNQGFREWNGSALNQPRANSTPDKRVPRILVVIHGTFSECDAIFKQLSAPDNVAGRNFLASAYSHYDQILAFDHPTLSVSPMLNALKIARRFNDCKADIDIICHSRGGLVTRWWLEAFDRGSGRRRAVLVGSPLAGTSLASPRRLRHVLSWFSNISRALGGGAAAVSSLIPFMTVVACLARFTAMVTSIGSNAPVLDAAISMIPGLSAMSLTSNNRELSELNAGKRTKTDYFVVKSHFLPDSVGWKFWECFTDPKRAATLLFPGETDLVVDSDCMNTFCNGVSPQSIYDFGGTSTVFHTNYFSHRETCENIAKWLKI
jgi:hypothetical protein